MVGHALGANKPNLAIANCKLFLQVTTIFNMVVALSLILSKSAIINLFTDDSEVISRANATFPLMALSFFFGS